MDTLLRGVSRGGKDVAHLAKEELLAASGEDGNEARWISVNGLYPYVVDQMRRHFVTC
ncbi:MAG: hypothetical protein HQL31_02715 [Planctomycetes bacterium]|nr:hypothetical protein [Planctomycetota bacterium]